MNEPLSLREAYRLSAGTRVRGNVVFSAREHPAECASAVIAAGALVLQAETGRVTFEATPVQLSRVARAFRNSGDVAVEGIAREDDGSYEHPELNVGFIQELTTTAGAVEAWRVHGRLDISGDVDDNGRWIDDTAFTPVFAVNAETGEMAELAPHHPEDLMAFAERFTTGFEEPWFGDDLLCEILFPAAKRAFDAALRASTEDPRYG